MQARIVGRGGSKMRTSRVAPRDDQRFRAMNVTNKGRHLAVIQPSAMNILPCAHLLTCLHLLICANTFSNTWDYRGSGVPLGTKEPMNPACAYFCFSLPARCLSASPYADFKKARLFKIKAGVPGCFPVLDMSHILHAPLYIHFRSFPIDKCLKILWHDVKLRFIFCHCCYVCHSRFF